MSRLVQSPVAAPARKVARADSAGNGPGSITRRVAFFCTLYAGVTLAVLLAFAYWQASSALRERAHAELTAERDILIRSLGAASGLNALQGDPSVHGLRTDHAGLNIAILARGGTAPLVAIGAETQHLLALDLRDMWTGIREFDAGASLLAVAIDEVSLRDDTVLRVAVAIDRTSDRELLAAYRLRLLLMWTAAICLMGVLAGAVARGALRLLRSFTEQVATISAAKLGRRIEPRSVPVELEELAATFNALLARLDAAFRRLDTFAADMAHELRGPVANLVTRTQIVLSRVRSEGDYRAALESNAEELERLRRMIDDMLLLARAENPATQVARKPLELRALCEDLAEFYQIAADERALRIEVSGDAVALGDADLVRRAIANLLSNALRHAHSGSSVRLSVERDATGDAVVRVQNAGRGIANALRPQLFQRYAHSAARGGGDDRGNGLGLAIVRSIMQLHGGAAGVDSPPGSMTTFWLRFPARPG